MDSQLEILSEQLIRYRELLALAYAQKDAIQKGDLAQFASLLSVREELIARARLTEGLLTEDHRDAPGEDRETHRRLMSEAASLLEKLVSLDKENERLLEVRMVSGNGARGTKANDQRTAYSRDSGRKQGASGILDRSK